MSSPQTPLNDAQWEQRAAANERSSKAWQAAEEWCKRGDEATGGGVLVGDRKYSKKECYAFVVAQSHAKERTYARAWYRLGQLGGHQGSGRVFSRRECYRRAVDSDWEEPLYWLCLASEMSPSTYGTTKKITKVLGQDYDVKECCLEALRRHSSPPHFSQDHRVLSDSALGYTWSLLGVMGGGTVGDDEYSKAQCFRKALTVGDDDPNNNPPYIYKSLSWSAFGDCGGGIVGEALYNKRACYIESLEHSVRFEATYGYCDDVHRQVRMWVGLGHANGGRVCNKSFRDKDCFVKALTLRVEHKSEQQDGYRSFYARVWIALGEDAGGMFGCWNVPMEPVGGMHTESECYREAIKLDPKNRRAYELLLGMKLGNSPRRRMENYTAWKQLAALGGGTVGGTVYDPAACSRMAQKYKITSAP